jgi:hypothetical protein
MIPSGETIATSRDINLVNSNTQISNVLGKTFLEQPSSSMSGKSTYFKIFVNMKIKGSKQDSQK